MSDTPADSQTPLPSALLLGRNNGVGLDRDAAILSGLLAELGYRVSAPPPRSVVRRLLSPADARVAVHLERAWTSWRRKGAVHILIPNQERYPVRQLGRLRAVDHIFCKSHHAREIFSRYHSSVHFTGFTSPDRKLPGRTPDYSRFLHLAGRSSLKNTESVLEVWRRNPGFPLLTLIQHGDHKSAAIPANVRVISTYLSDAALRELQNECGVHISPSLAEGWGHYIPEAMSCEGVVITTDAPPMHEIVTPDRGILVPVHRTEPRHLGTKFFVDVDALEERVSDVIGSSDESKGAMGGRAREWFLENQAHFAERFRSVLQELIGAG